MSQLRALSRRSWHDTWQEEKRPEREGAGTGVTIRTSIVAVLPEQQLHRGVPLNCPRHHGGASAGGPVWLWTGSTRSSLKWCTFVSGLVIHLFSPCIHHPAAPVILYNSFIHLASFVAVCCAGLALSSFLWSEKLLLHGRKKQPNYRSIGIPRKMSRMG